MNKKAFVLAAALFFTLSPLMAITFGVPDGNEHPYVGMVVFTPDFESFYVCSGTLIAPQVPDRRALHRLPGECIDRRRTPDPGDHPGQL